MKRGSKILPSACSLAEKNDFKGVDTVIRALPTILKAQSGVQYVVVGDGGLRDKLASLAIETGVAENVTFAGEISDVELAELYRRSAMCSYCRAEDRAHPA